MIRIQLGRRPAASRLRVLLLTLGALAAMIAGAVLARQIPLDLWDRITRCGSAQVADEPEEPVAVAAAAGSRPRRSDVCRRVLQLSERLPRGVSFTTLAGRADGEYALRGSGSATSMPMLLAAVDTLSAWSDDVGLSYWHSADSLASIEYHLSGRLAGDAAVELELVPPSTARDLVVGIEGRARASGLDQIVTEAIDGRRLDGVAALRTHKLWASGSYDQIRTFAESLGEVESRARVEELVIAFASQPEGMSAWGQVSASYVVVTESAEEER